MTSQKIFMISKKLKFFLILIWGLDKSVCPYDSNPSNCSKHFPKFYFCVKLKIDAETA